MAATETGAGLAAAAFLYVVKILNGRATYGEFAYNEKQERIRQALIFVSEPAYINLKIVCIDKHSDPDVLSITHQRRRLILVRETYV